jgi:hypothetical protein
MTDELAELKQRQDELEEFVNVLESRLSTQETLMCIVDTVGMPTVRTDTQAGDFGEQDTADTEADESGVRNSGHESLLRSIALHQSFHGTHLKRVEREQRELKKNTENAAGKLAAIEETLRRIDRSVHALVKRSEGG